MKSYNYHPYIDDWVNLVETGQVQSCKEQKALIKFTKKVLNSKDVVIEGSIIDEAVDVIEKYFPFKLIHFQKFFIAMVVGVYYTDGSLVFDEFFALMGRGSGKNGLITALVFYFLSDKHGIKDYNVDIIATSEDQAKTSFDELYNIIEDTDKLQKLFKKTKEEIIYKKTRSKLKFRTSNAKTKDGGRPGCVIFDEVHQYENYDNINVHIGGLGKVDRPRTFYITTDGEVRESVLDDLKEKSDRILKGEDEHNGFFPFIFKMDDIKEVDKKELWEKSIPRINHSKVLKDRVNKEYTNMLTNVDLKQAFLTKRMNIPNIVEGRAVATWKDIKATNQPIPDLTGYSCIGSVDYADLRDFCSVGLLFKHGGKRYFIQHTFVHEKSIQLTKYNINIEEAEELGLLTIVRGTPQIPARTVVEWFIEQAEKYNIIKVVADRYRYSALKEEFDKEGLILGAIPNGFISHNKLHPLITQIFLEHTIAFGDDKLMRWYVNNVFVHTDKKGNKSFLKIDPIKRKTDGFFALLHAMNADEELIEDSSTIMLDVYTY
ncbi:terminase large subunit domain-containing protein [Clostridium sp. UBA2485]|uniref:terminase large subunit domain-containing protein n=1 Tax=Clostridium sp. UBA2485 TaxID=1946352 RepID=UPI0025C502B3|nr:terminase large subunit [Clostridium sp. UBA2485]